MTVGLLLCDRLDDEVAASSGTYPQLYHRAFDPTGVELRIYQSNDGEFPESPDECDAWLISGSRHCSYSDEPWIAQLHEIAAQIIASPLRLAGICFGHQVIARVLGGDVGPAEAGWGVGVRSFDVLANTAWMQPPAERFSLLMSHRDQVTALPDTATLLATADYCPNAAYCVEDRIFCVQGHPEWVPEVSRALTTARREQIGAATADIGLASLDRPLDSELVIAWIAQFLQQ